MKNTSFILQVLGNKSPQFIGSYFLTLVFFGLGILKLEFENLLGGLDNLY